MSAREYGFESRCPRQNGLVVQRPSDRVAIAIIRGGRIHFGRPEGSLVCTQEMRVRLPPSPPTVCCGGKGRRPWRSHKPRHAGSIPASATIAGSFNGRTAVLQAAHGGSIPSPATNFCCEGSVTASTGGCGPPGRVRVPPSPHFESRRDLTSGRRVIGSPPASGAGAWRFDSSRPETNPGFVQRQDFRPITGESGFESSSLDQVDEVLLAARLPRKQEARVRLPASAPFRPAS